MNDKVMPNNSQVKFKKTEVEDHHRISSNSNKTKSVTACNDSLKSITSNGNVVCATCGKYVFNLNHDACVSKFIHEVNARTKKPKVGTISTRQPKSQANKSVATPLRKPLHQNLLSRNPRVTIGCFMRNYKAKRSSFTIKVIPSSKGRLNLLHMDLCGPMRVKSINGKKYFLVIVEDYSRYTWTLFLRSKDETLEVLKDFLNMLQRNLQAQVITIRTDRGTEFINNTLNVFFKEEGIEHQTSTPRTPEQNGVVKRRNHTLVEAARTMLSASKLPVDGENLDKMKEKGDPCILVGYSTQSKGYCVYNKRTRLIVKSIHLKFDEIKEMYVTSVANDTSGIVQRVEKEAKTVCLAQLACADLLKSLLRVVKGDGDGTVPTPRGTTQVVTRGILMIRCQVAGTRYCSSDVAGLEFEPVGGLISPPPRQQLTWLPRRQRWPPFDPTVDWRSTAIDQWLTGGPAMVDRWSRWRLRGTVHQRGQYEVQNSEGQYEVQNSEESIRGDCDVERMVSGQSKDSWNRSYQMDFMSYDDSIEDEILTMPWEDRSLSWVDQSQVEYMTLTEAVKEVIWLKGFSTESEFEPRLVVGIATGALTMAIPEIRLAENLSYDNSSPRPPEECNSEIADTIVESLSPSPILVEDNDSLMEEIDLFLASDDSMPPGIEDDEYDSEGDIRFLEELLSNDSPPLPENESFSLDHFNDPSLPRSSSRTTGLGFNLLVHSFRALSTLRRSGLRTASAAAKPCQGDSSEVYLITGRIPTVAAAGQRHQAANIDQSPPREKSLQEMEDLKRECEDMIDELKSKFNGMSIEINKRKVLQRLEQEIYIPLRDIISKLPPSIAITPVLPTLEPEDSLIMGDEELSIIPEMESDEFIKSSVEDLVPILSESEDTSGSDSDCDLPSYDDFSPINIFEEKSVQVAVTRYCSSDGSVRGSEFRGQYEVLNSGGVCRVQAFCSRWLANHWLPRGPK
ncbi:retrovirus-related pol polyprotein from transposon TNT 1-94 [Tanacetum coccineum]